MFWFKNEILTHLSKSPYEETPLPQSLILCSDVQAPLWLHWQVSGFFSCTVAFQGFSPSPSSYHYIFPLKQWMSINNLNFILTKFINNFLGFLIIPRKNVAIWKHLPESMYINNNLDDSLVSRWLVPLTKSLPRYIGRLNISRSAGPAEKPCRNISRLTRCTVVYSWPHLSQILEAVLHPHPCWPVSHLQLCWLWLFSLKCCLPLVSLIPSSPGSHLSSSPLQLSVGFQPDSVS